MKRKQENKKTLISYIGIPGLLLIFGLLYILGRNAITNSRLNKNGIYTWATIYEKESVGGKGVISTKYYFTYRRNKFYGESRWDDKVNVGDSIIVFFLKSDPNVNRSNSLLEIPISSTKTQYR